jgi:UDP-N-acetylmuramate dehydrogenase
LSQSTDQSASALKIERDIPVSTWFHIGGSATQLARAQSIEQLIACLEIDQDFYILGEGANLLVDDDGVDSLVVSLQNDGFRDVSIDETTGVVRASAGVALPNLISRCVRAGLGGLEVLAGIPATVGGAVIMNAGGAFGSVADLIVEVTALDRAGRLHTFDRSQIDFDYRQSRLNHLIVTEAVLQLHPMDKELVKRSLNKCMSYKSDSQPLSDKSAGCVFKNPMLSESIPEVAQAGQRAGAGKLIDLTGCKGMAVHGAQVSQVHANFITTTKDAKASHVIELISQVENQVFDRFGVRLKRELVIWSDKHPMETSS